MFLASLPWLQLSLQLNPLLSITGLPLLQIATKIRDFLHAICPPSPSNQKLFLHLPTRNSSLQPTPPHHHMDMSLSLFSKNDINLYWCCFACDATIVHSDTHCSPSLPLGAGIHSLPVRGHRVDRTVSRHGAWEAPLDCRWD